MSEEHSSPDGSNGDKGSPPTLRSVESGTIPGHEAITSPVFLGIGDDSLSDGEISFRIDKISRPIERLIEDFETDEKQRKARGETIQEDILTQARIILHVLLTELSIEADLDKLREETLKKGGTLGQPESTAFENNRKIEQLIKASALLLEQLMQDMQQRRFIRDVLDPYTDTHHSKANVLRSIEKLKIKIPTQRMPTIIAHRILRTMLYLNDNPKIKDEILPPKEESKQAPSQ